MKAVIIPVTAFQQNCSVLWCTETNKAAVVDPGGEIERINAAIEEQDVEVEKILLTHGHIDHAGAAADLSEQLGVPIEGPHIEDKFWIEQLAEQGARFGVEAGRPFTPSRWLDQGDSVTVGNLTFEVRFCPPTISTTLSSGTRISSNASSKPRLFARSSSAFLARVSWPE